MPKQYDNTDTGAFFKNKKKKSANHPDYTGSLNVNGVEYWLSVWNKTSKGGRPFCSVSITAKEDKIERDENPIARSIKSDMDDDIPFIYEWR